MEVDQEEGRGQQHAAAADREGGQVQCLIMEGAGTAAAAGAMQPGPAPPSAAPQQPWSCHSYMGVHPRDGDGPFKLHMKVKIQGSRRSLDRSGYAMREDAAAARDVVYIWNCLRSGGGR